jgi:hypothetical protein
VDFLALPATHHAIDVAGDDGAILGQPLAAEERQQQIALAPPQFSFAGEEHLAQKHPQHVRLGVALGVHYQHVGN